MKHSRWWLLGAALLALASPAAATAKQRDRAQTITVMTRNVFLGADLAPAINATTIPQAIDGAGVIWNEMQSTKFAERAKPLAREIKRSRADLVGLQEVALWRKQEPSDGGAPPISPIAGATAATQVEQDFLEILKRELGRSYRVVVVQEEFDAELPVDVDGSDATGTGPLAGFGADFDARLTMRDVILVRRGSKVKLGRTRTGHFDTRYEPNVGGIVIPVDRGWASVEARVGRNSFRFVDTHLEAFGDPKIREAQAKELTQGPLKTRKQVILVGDLNSGIRRHNEPEQPGDDLAFRALAGFGMKDNGAVQSCCYDSLFDANAVFDHTVDHVLSKPGLRKLRAFVTGNDADERTASGLWPSDHGGVVSRLRLKR
jgi:endonuclease/exonuclease/phosphatase family metal-dependent hydrolase